MRCCPIWWPFCLAFLWVSVSRGEAPEADKPPRPGTIRLNLPALDTNHRAVNEAFRIALGDLVGNVRPFKDGLLPEPAPVILAGMDYDTPWTRDAAINASNGASLLMPEVARNTLLSVLTRSGGDGKVLIGGQYWDAIVWVTGAWHHYLYTGDRQFLKLAFQASRDSLAYFERTEFDAKNSLFRGPGWSDGIAGYPDEFAKTGGSSGILDWPRHNPDKVSKPGYGIPMEALSTNCLYYNAYLTAGQMAAELGEPADPEWAAKARALKDAINRHLWMPEKGHYRFFVSPLGNCDHQEGLGHAYAILFGVADASQTEAIFKNLHVTPAGLPCEWPSFRRYDSADGTAFARHAGTVWPQIQGFWAEAAARLRKPGVFGHEFLKLAGHAARDRQFVEIYHPLTGRPYGGMQEAGPRGIVLWQATTRQTWAATAYLRMVLMGLAGMRFQREGVSFEPCVPKGITRVELRNVQYRKASLHVVIEGTGTKLQECRIDGRPAGKPFVAADSAGRKEVFLRVVPE